MTRTCYGPLWHYLLQHIQRGEKGYWLWCWTLQILLFQSTRNVFGVPELPLNSLLGTTVVPFLSKRCPWVIEMLANMLSLEALVHCPLSLFFEIYWSCLKPNDVSWRMKYCALSTCFLLPEAAGWSVLEHPTTNCCRIFSVPTHFCIGLGAVFLLAAIHSSKMFWLVYSCLSILKEWLHRFPQ